MKLGQKLLAGHNWLGSWGKGKYRPAPALSEAPKSGAAGGATTIHCRGGGGWRAGWLASLAFRPCQASLWGARETNTPKIRNPLIVRKVVETSAGKGLHLTLCARGSLPFLAGRECCYGIYYCFHYLKCIPSGSEMQWLSSLQLC